MKAAPRAWHGLILLLAVGAAYAMAPWGDLVWDDQLVAKQQMAAIHGLGDVFSPPPDIPQWTYTYYRPVVVLSYLLDQWLFGRGAAAGPHVANVLYHLLATFLAWMLARRLLRGLPRGDIGALAAATLFAVHPIHTESVSWVTGRSDLLATLFLLPSLLALLRWRDRGSTVALLFAALLYIAALLAKEVAITGLALAPLLLIAAPREPAVAAPGRPARGRAGAALMWAGAGIAYLGAAGVYWSLRQGAGTASASLAPQSLAELLTLALRALGYYLSKLALPWPQSNFVPWEAVPGPAASAAILVLAVAAWALLPWRGPAARPALAGVAWIGITLAPALASALTAVAATPVAERYLYLPSVGLAIALGASFCRARAGRPGSAVSWAAGVVVAVAAAATIARGAVWLSDLRLWSDAVGKSGDYAVPLIEYGKAQFQAGLREEADATFLRAREVADTPRLHATSAFNLGAIAAMRGDVPGAQRLFSEAIASDATYPLAHYGLGRAWFEQAQQSARSGDLTRAREMFARARTEQEIALRLNPSQASAHLELARVLAGEAQAAQAAGEPGAAARLRDALDHVDAAVALEPSVSARPEVRELEARLQFLVQRVPR